MGIVGAGIGEHQPLAYAPEQLYAETRFKFVDFFADGAVRLLQLGGGFRKALMTRRRLERLQCRQAGNSSTQ
jgi:hypothetical protein